MIGLLIKDRNFALQPRVATVLAQIACFKDGLPQGSPCSPVFANVIGRVLDSKLSRLAAEKKCTYTRYADDITFSTNLKEFPASIAVQTNGDTHEWLPGEDLRSAIARCGFAINDSKTRMQYRNSRQEVTGLTVNRKISVPSHYRKLVRAMVHSLVTKGSFIKTVTMRDATGSVIEESTACTLDQLHGMLGFINMVDSHERSKTSTSAPVRSITSESMYRKFLMYKLFYSAQAPTILCEGITAISICCTPCARVPNISLSWFHGQQTVLLSRK